MSIPRVMFSPTHPSGIAGAVAAAAAELLTRSGRRLRFHRIGAGSPKTAWDRWGGSSFLDLCLYGGEELTRLYDRSTHGADLSLLASEAGLLDSAELSGWSPAKVAHLLDCPVILVLDCRGWEEGIAALIAGFRNRLRPGTIAGVLLSGVRDEAHAEVLRRALDDISLKLVGCFFADDVCTWDIRPPGAWGVPLREDFLRAVSARIDLSGVEAIAGQRGYLPASHGAADRRQAGPLILVAGGQGFTPWSWDSIETLRAAGARVRRLDLVEDTQLPDDAAGLVVAGHIWLDSLSDLARNEALMRHVRVRISEGLPTIALGGGFVYLCAIARDTYGRTHQLAGLVPDQVEIIEELDQPVYLDVRAELDTPLLKAGERVTAWMTADMELMGMRTGAGRLAGRQPLTVGLPGARERRAEGMGGATLLCSRALIHLASSPSSVSRFLGLCRDGVGL